MMDEIQTIASEFPKSEVEDVLRTLLKLRQGGPQHPSYGICGNAGYLKGTQYDILFSAFQHWPKYSGMPCYPVPGPSTGENSAISAYNRAEDCWDRSTEYGQMRWELLDFSIEFLTLLLQAAPDDNEGVADAEQLPDVD